MKTRKRNNDHETNQLQNSEPRPFRESAGHQRAPARGRIGPRSYGQSPRNLRNFIFPNFSLAGSRVVDQGVLGEKNRRQENQNQTTNNYVTTIIQKMVGGIA